MENVKNSFIEEHKLRLTADSLHSAVATYERIINNEVATTPEMKKAVQTSIKELCTALITAID